MKIDVADQVSASPRKLVFAYYVTGHGFGHATRVVEVVRHLVAAGHDVHVVTGAPDFVFTSEIQSPNLFIRKVLLDCGAVQPDALTVDRLASLEKYSETAVVPRASILTAEVEWLHSIQADLVVSDVVPVACRAAADAGIRSVCVTNFSWDFIYAEYVVAAGHNHRSIILQIAEDYSHCEFLLRLPGYCPMPAFRDVIDVPLVVRRLHKSRAEVRSELGIGHDVKLVLFNFGGQPAGWVLKQECLPDGWLCLVCGASDKQLPANFVRLPKDVYTPDLIASCDCMLGKIGYGTVSEALAYRIPFVFVRRDYFNEEPFLRNMLEYYQGGVEMIRRDLLTGRWKPYLERALKLNPCYEGAINGGEVASDYDGAAENVVACSFHGSHVEMLSHLQEPESRTYMQLAVYMVSAGILQITATGKRYKSHKFSGASRLRDAIVLGYQLQRAPGGEISIPEWYAVAENEFGFRPSLPKSEANEKNSVGEICIEDFEILHGELHGLSDTVAFLKGLAGLDVANDSSSQSEKRQMRERIAAASFFNWEEDIFVTRAPGRLDVMGGIADYSGSLVLQMPIREACHVAVQKIHPSKQRLWKHAEARQQCKGLGRMPVLQIVSFGSELSNRAPTFDMDLADLMDGDLPMSYESACKFFAQDPSQKWASYVAGTILVLMSELGIRFHDSISILVSSAVPEGKGVSSSAAVEVATMSAIAAAHGLEIAPRDLAILCQKVENRVVGAPCGVMDQMTSACGEANKLLAMVCQPAEVKELVCIPTHIRLWGIDSGIRHRMCIEGIMNAGIVPQLIKNLDPWGEYCHIGGTDYGSVRVGTFMGRRIIKSEAATSCSRSLETSNVQQQVNDINGDEYEEHGEEVELLKAEASLDYLCNLSPHRYEAVYASKLPDFMLGEDFLNKYVDHGDTVTTIDPKRQYGLSAPTKHPIYENSRVKAFKALLTAAATDEQLSALGELLYQCHYSYSACGLGSDGTDRLVKLVQQMQHRKSSRDENVALFGAKITGGGSGGSVCVIGRNCARSSEEIIEIQQRYKAATGYLPFVFEGSSPGAGKFGYLRLRRRKV